jgi:peroxiredoxin Q/BCP
VGLTESAAAARRERSAMIEIGKRAPAFTLPDQDGRKVKLSDHKGRWVVLYFYPKDDTPGCTVEACDFTAGLGDFAALDAVVYGCSPDGPESHRKFIGKHGLKVGLLSDPDHAVLEKYGAWGEKSMYGKKSMGVIRSTVLIDPDGKVADHWPKVQAKGHADEVRARLAELRAERA